MRQVLFTVPILKDYFPPDGIPIYGFGAMLFVTFVLVTWWGTHRAKKIGMPAAKFQDFTIWVFVSGIVGARVLYMIQYAHQFPNSITGILGSFFRIWEGGIVFYGSALGGAIGYGLFYWFVMRRLRVSGWQLADAVAPLLAMGLAIGRIGCYLNGCCWGQAANVEACPVPLGAAHFPLLPAHARGLLVGEKFLQTSTGFAVAPRGGIFDDPRARVTAVEYDSPAARAGLKRDDVVVGVNGQPNWIVVEFPASDRTAGAVDAIKEATGVQPADGPLGRFRFEFEDPEKYRLAQGVFAAAPDVTPTVFDRLEELARDWPRGKAELRLVVVRNGERVELPPFSPVTVGLYPTQLYETVSMVLLIFLLVAFYPYRRHDGQLFVLLMIGYAIHRFINESLRVEPSYTGGLTLSQWGSVIVLSLGVALEVYLWLTMPSRWKSRPRPEPTPPAA